MILKSRTPKMMGMMLRQVHLGLQRRSEIEFAKYGINWTDFQVIRFLSEKSSETSYDATQKDIADFMQLTVHSVSKSLKVCRKKASLYTAILTTEPVQKVLNRLMTVNTFVLRCLRFYARWKWTYSPEYQAGIRVLFETD